MKDDRFAPPSYNYEPRRLSDRGACLTAAIMWGGLAIVAAVELWLAFAFVPGASQ